MTQSNNYLNYLKNASQEVVSSQNPGLRKSKHSKNQMANIDKDIQAITKNVMNTGISNISGIDESPSISAIGLESSQELGENIIKNSSLNDILDFEDYQKLLNNIKKYIKTHYGNKWYAESIQDTNLFTGLLKEVSALIEILYPMDKELNIENLNIDKILDKLANMYFYIFLIFIHENDEMSIYSLLNSYIKLSEDTNFQRDKGLIFHNAWDTLVLPISIKQPHLILIKLLDFWFGLDSNWNALKKRINIKILKDENN